MSKAEEIKEKMDRIMERMSLNEMATVYRTGPFAFVVYSDHTPPYFHILQNGQTICKVVIPPAMPQTIDDIQIMKTDLNIPITNKFKKMILETMSRHNKQNIEIYPFICATWDSMNEDYPIDTYNYANIGSYII